MGNAKSRVLTEEEVEEERALKSKAKKLDNTHSVLKKADKNVIKALLLGAGESGKSTLFKQIQLNYGSGFSDSVYEEHRSILQRNILGILQTVIAQAQRYAKKDAFYQLDERNAALIELITSIDARKTMEPNLDTLLRLKPGEIDDFLSDPVVERTLERRNEYQLIDTVDYLLSRIHVILSEDFTPTVEDILNARRRTTGIVEMMFDLGSDRKLLVVDVGGQRNERKKWINCFDEVDNVIFVVGLSGYNQTVFEDRSRNRLDEALDLFASVVKNPAFKDTSFTLLLNKMDLFKEKLKLFPLNTKFAAYQGDNSPEDAANFVKKLFSGKTAPTDSINTQFTTATDVENMKKIMKALRGHLVTKRVSQLM